MNKKPNSDKHTPWQCFMLTFIQSIAIHGMAPSKRQTRGITAGFSTADYAIGDFPENSRSKKSPPRGAKKMFSIVTFGVNAQ
jgi:hypothetical protein